MLTLLAAVFLSAAAPPASVTVTDLAGRTQEGEVEAFEKGRLRIRSGEEIREIPAEEIRTVSVRLAASSKPEPVLFLSDGSALPGRVGEIDKERVALRSESLGTRTFPLSAVRAVRFPDVMKSAEALAAFEQDRAKNRDPIDRLFVVRGTAHLTIPATVLSIGETEILVRWEGSERRLERDKTFGIVFGRSAPPPTPPEAARIHLTDGGMILAPIRSWTRGRLVAAAAGGELEVPAATVSSVEFSPDRLAYLSDLVPAESVDTPLLKGAAGYAVAWPMRKDGCARGGPLRLGRKTYPKGIGVHSRSRIGFDLNGDYKTFHAVAGIDDSTEGRGHCVFRILGDGKPLAAEFALKGTDAPKTISADVSGVRRLVLEVDYGEGLDLSDFADWADARVVK
ncbi:MAG: NPCBM/NEW2 domain-containing protein [Planctomycetota bacterium]